MGKKSAFGLLCLLSTVLVAEQGTNGEQNSQLSSSNASYDGNALLLKGQVLLDHGLGKMKAEEAKLERQKGGKDFPFSLIHLKTEVELSVKNNTTLSCGSACLDFTSLKGLLFSSDSQPVAFVDTLKKKGSAADLLIKSAAAELTFLKGEDDTKKTTYTIATILAKEGVVIHYDKSITLTADHALYRKEGGRNPSAQEFQGVLSAYPKNGESKCHITQGSDHIDADSVDFDLIKNTLSLYHPVGQLSSSFFPALQKGHLHFRSDHLFWNQEQNTLLLKGNVSLEESILGTVSAANEMLIEQGLIDGKQTIKAIRSNGPTSLEYKLPSSEELHKLRCYGTLVIDRDQLSAVLTSPQKEEGGSLQKQIYYEENAFAVYADKAFLDYSQEANTFHPIALCLKGRVRLFSRDPKEPHRCSVADRLNYSPHTKTLILCGSADRKVLFWDEEQGIRMSAAEVHITQDPSTHKSIIKGIGNVQFALSAEEGDQLKKIFPQYKSAEPQQTP